MRVFTSFFVFFFLTISFAALDSTTSESASWAKFYPYAPEKNEYQFELGGMQESAGLYWVGLGYGRRLGHCFGFSAANCEQYLDFNLGFANNYQATDEVGLAGVRWQFVNSAHMFSPFARAFVGVIDEHDQVRSGAVGTGGAGVGLVATVHPRFDVTLEARAGEADRFWSLALVAFSMRLDRVVSSTVQVTGDLIKTTMDGPKTFVDWFNNKDTSESEQKKDPP